MGLKDIKIDLELGFDSKKLLEKSAFKAGQNNKICK